MDILIKTIGLTIFIAITLFIIIIGIPILYILGTFVFIAVVSLFFLATIVEYFINGKKDEEEEIDY